MVNPEKQIHNQIWCVHYGSISSSHLYNAIIKYESTKVASYNLLTIRSQFMGTGYLSQWSFTDLTRTDICS